MECPVQARRVPSASTKRLSGASSPGAATVDTTASRAGARARLAGLQLITPGHDDGWFYEGL
jgi:hypothetical protein